MDLFQLLTLTYSRYVDAPSREAVETIGIELVRRDELRGTPEGEPDTERLGVTELIVNWLANEVDRMAKRPRCVLYPCTQITRNSCACLLVHILPRTCSSS